MIESIKTLKTKANGRKRIDHVIHPAHVHYLAVLLHYSVWKKYDAPLRHVDCANAKVRETLSDVLADDENYLCLETRMWKISGQSKTEVKHEYLLPNDVIQEIRVFRDKYGSEIIEYLFPNANNGKHSPEDFGRKMRQFVGPLTKNRIKKASKILYKHRDAIIELSDQAKAFGHSLSTHIQDYSGAMKSKVP